MLGGFLLGHGVAGVVAMRYDRRTDGPPQPPRVTMVPLMVMAVSVLVVVRLVCVMARLTGRGRARPVSMGSLIPHLGLEGTERPTVPRPAGCAGPGFIPGSFAS